MEEEDQDLETVVVEEESALQTWARGKFALAQNLWFQSGCDAGWRRFNRPSGGWCVKVFGARMNQADAQIQCQSHGATLSGLQNSEEAQQISSEPLCLETSLSFDTS